MGLKLAKVLPPHCTCSSSPHWYAVTLRLDIPSFGLLQHMCTNQPFMPLEVISILRRGRPTALRGGTPAAIQRGPPAALPKEEALLFCLLVRRLGQTQALSVAAGGPEGGGCLGSCRESLPDVAALPDPSERVSVGPLIYSWPVSHAVLPGLRRREPLFLRLQHWPGGF